MSDGPSVTDEPDRPAGEILAGEELQLLDALLDAEGVATCRTPCIPKLGARVAPLSSAQRRLWFLQEIDPLSSAYTISGAVLLRGDLDLAALQAALDGVVARHEVLRTTFESDAGEPRQRVHAAMPVVLRRTPGDASLPAAESARVAAELAHPAWDLGRGPLVRAAVVEFSPREHSLVIAMHHIVADGWSIGILLRELGALYNAGLAHLPPSLPEPPVQYADYALWQRQWLEREVLDEELRYWKQQLAGAPERLDLPADGPQPATRGRRGAQQPLSLSAELTESLKALGRREGATLFMTLLAAFQALLHRYTGQDDIVLGTPVAGRHQSEVEGLIGFFVNTLVLRSDLSGDPTFVQLLGRVREVALGAYAHQDLPFEQLVEALRPARDMRHTPLFQVMFALQNAPAEELHLQGLSSTLLPIDVPTAKFDLTLNLAEEGPLLSGTFEYDADRFASATVLRMAGHFQTLLEAIAAHPWTRLSRLPLLTEKESHQLLADREPLHDGAPGRCAHRCFEEQAERTPEAVAVEFQERMLTYGELDQRANQLAHLLRGMGVGSDDVVGLHMERSLEMVVGLLGIQKAGGAYLPLDPSYPRERRSFMLRDARAVLLLTQTGLQDDLPGTAAPIIAVDDRWKLLEGHSRAAPAGSPRPESLAYVIYTSGSTGSPRGVMISHRALGNHMRWMAAAFPLAESDRVLQKTPTSFDASVWEFYAPLIAGARLILARPEGHQDAAYLIDTVQQQGITTLQLVPSMLALLLEDEGVRSCTSLKRVFCGGEVLPWEMQERFFAQLPAADLINLYGPTEATIDATFWACRKSGPRRKVPIGSPIANLRAYVLDSRLQLLPLGVPGELHLAGDGLARGYRGDPAWTAQRFVPDPFSAAAGARLYRTGDLARRLAGGELEFLGRIDHQVKMRGLRVDPQEIEAVLAEHPAVSKAAVVACEDPAGSASQGPRLVAYLAPVPGKAPTPEDLRSFLGERLPRFMIPAVFVSLEALPLTPSGKIDRRALPSPRSIGPALDGAGIAPRTPTEEILAGIWSQLLRIERVGREDNFFDLGGHSLLAMRVAVRLRRLFGIELPLRCLFDAPTLRGLAARVEQAGRSPTPPLVPATPAQRLRPSYAQRRLWFLHRLEPHSPAYNIANAIRVEGKLDVKAIGSALSEIVRRHEALRTRFEEGPDGPVPLVDPPAPVALTIEDLTGLAPDSREGEAARLAGRAARESFDLAHGPLLRVRLLRLGPADHILIVVIHHIAADGWSMGVLVRELAAAYAAHARGATLPGLPPLEVQYADWAAWQRAWLEGGEMERQLAWWRAELDGLEPLALPTDRPRSGRPTYAGASLEVRLDADLVGRLTGLARSEGATLHMALLAAFAAVLGRWSGQRDFGIGTPVAGRSREEAEPLIGCFVNSLVVRARLGGDRLPYRELLGRIREAALGGYANQDVPFERVVEELQPDRDLSRTPLFQVMFILQNAPAGELDLGGGVRLTPFDAPIETSTFDLTLSLAPLGDALDGFMEYSTELFEEATIRRLWDHFVRLLESVADDPAADVRRARLLGSDEYVRIVQEWSGRNRVGSADRLVHELFAEQAVAEPERLAAVLGDRRVTYGEIHERSDRLAARLAEHAVGPESRVGLCVQRSPELLVGLMAVLKAGGAFVPLDPEHPRDRLAFALRDAGARVVLATGASAPLVEGPGREIIRLDDERSYAAGPLRPRRRPSPAGLAYVIYTSGTTGRPKGVMVAHGALSAAYLAWERLYGFPGIRSHLQMAGVGFDVCTGDVLRALCSGGTLVFCEREQLLDSERLFELARREQVEFAEFVPAVLRPLAAYARKGGRRLPSVRLAVVGSDLWTAAEIAEFRAVFGPGTRLANGYGVTEATIDSTCWFVGDGVAAGNPPIGRPLAHTTVYVLDDRFEPVPAGITGELFLGGPAVARGYIGRPDATAERFLPDPFGEPGDRLYRTGDRARYTADGCLLFAGRLDDQVKIRGLRVEPAEVETLLASFDSVAACAVVPRRDPRGAPCLAAYVVPRDGTSFDPEAARRLLRAELPEAMVPAAIVGLEALPLTLNGKVDRSKLPEPEWGVSGAYEPPRTATELAVAAAFAQVLERARVGAGDDFFALGGHSLLATQVISRLRAALGVELPLRAIFEAPTVRALAACVGAPGESGAPPPVGRATEEERRRPSYAQRRLWFLDRLEPGSAAYNLPSSILLEGDLDVAALERSFGELVRRQEALRTRFVEGPDPPEQVIDAPAALQLGSEDLSGLPEGMRQRAVERLTREEARRPFDLARGPLLRARLLRLEPVRHLLLVTVHHIAADGWSMGLLVRELGLLYGAYCRGHESPLPELPVQYADWAAWQRAWLAAGTMERQLAYWRAELEGVEPLALSSDRPRPARPTHAGAQIPVRLPAALRAALQRLAGEEGATLTMALLAGYAAALGRWSGQKDFAVGIPVANRRTLEAESLVGFFVNTLAVRLRVGGSGLTFRRLLGRVREAALGAYAHQDVPFERVVEELQPERYLGRNPVVQTLFALQNAPVGAIALPGLSLVYEEPDTGVTRFDVELFLAETPSGLEGTLNYSTELFDRETVERFSENFAAFLQSGVENPDRALGDLPALAPAQLHRVLAEWNAAREPYPDPPVVQALFERLAALDPEAPAAFCGDACLSYGELNARANRLARFLRRQGVGAENLVAVCLERSFDMVAALLAILKAGAAYVPVDPEYPLDRIALILEDARTPVVLTQASHAGRLPGRAARALLLDEDWEAIAREDPGDLGLDVPPDSLVYSVYTSGSTGRPKGVAMTHRAIANLLSWQRRDSGRLGALRTLQFASLSFDVSFQEIFSTLTAGGAIVLVTEEERRDATRLLRLMAAHRVQRLFLPFVALNQLAETAQSAGLSPADLKEINTAGEQLRITPALRAFFGKLPGCRLVNHYGPSETHLVTAFEMEGDPSRWPELPSIGRPIPNAPVFLLDDAGRPVPIGVPGELCVGGAGLARGYHARPELTAERFVPDPFSGEAGARLYRTGDLARFRTDGNLEFLGRLDLQVKVRGYRVEPGEIEAALSRHPAVRQAVVAAHEHRGGKRLAAYVLLHEGKCAAPAQLREHLARELPEFMVPAAILILEALPVTPNGKVDRLALPEPEWGAAATYIAPRTPQEEIVCGIFAEVLGLERVGVADNFFDLGGHSLLATQVISRVRRAFDAEVLLRILFESPTPAGVAAAAARNVGTPALPPIRRAAEPERRTLSYAQRRLWFLHQLEPASGVYNLPVALRLEGELDIAALGRALSAMVQRHEALRTRIVEGPNGPESIADDPFDLLLEAEDLSRAAGPPAAAAHQQLAEEAARPFDLARGPLVRVRLLRLGPGDHVLSVVAHHISADGWSMGVLVRDLGVLYAAFTKGRPNPLREMEVQYPDWAAWQRAWLEGGELDRQLAYWRAELEGAPRALELPTDRARPATATWRGATIPVALEGRLHARLQQLARSAGSTLHMALLAGYAWTLMRQGSQRDVVVGTPVANRRAAEAEPLVGFFVNTLAVRVRAGGQGMTYRDLLSRVRAACLGAYANQDVPFERVVEEIQPERSLNRAPVFQTAFALQNARLPPIDLPGLRVTPFEVDSATAKFDLMLTLEETAEGLAGAFEYNTDLFDRDTVQGIFSRFARVLAGGVTAPDTPLVEIPLLDEVERRRVLVEWNPPAPGPQGPALLHELFERQVRRTPDAPALARGPETLGYSELEARANRLANHLRSLGIGPERRVAVSLERSPEAILAILAVLKAGGAYVALDPGQPEERLGWLVRDSGASLVVADSRSSAKIAAGGAPLVLLDRDAAAIARHLESCPPARARPQNLAYVLYTSGSTGRPKGVGIEHRQIVSYVDAAIERLGIRPGWRFALLSTLAADLGNTAIFPCLATGGCLHLFPPEIALDPAGVEAYCDEHLIDCLKIVPSHLQALQGGARPERVLPRRLLILGGEATGGARLAALRQRAPDCRIANHYGPTETTVGAVAGFLGAADAARAGAPLGRPLGNTRAYVLDERLQPLPAGVPGELFLSGAGVARGYLGSPGLTAECFGPDPYSAVPGERLYRTGDRARWLTDGRLEFLGRGDGQVKVRGYRVETGEVKTAIESHPGVRQAVVVARADAAAGARLVAYVVPEPAASPTVDGLPRRRLPNGLALAELNRNETDYIFREIFERRAYVRHGITLRRGDIVFDVGANVGLFTVFASLAGAPAVVFAFEPNPHLLPMLRANASLYAPGSRIFPVGLAAEERTAPFTFFPGFSLLSGLYADAEADQQVVKSFLENQGRAGAEGAAGLAREAEALLEGRFAGRTFDVPLRVLSEVIAEHGVERIDLLKVNAEKAELDVLLGLREKDWPRISQIVVEVDLTANLAPILALLKEHDFEVLVDRDPLLERTQLCYVYAARRASGRTLAPGTGPSTGLLELGVALLAPDVLRAHLARSLPEPMLPSAWVFLESLPLTANGKLDRSRLPEPEAREGVYVAPRGELERAVAGIWSELLGRERIGAEDNFFDLGGHSLLLARVHARLRDTLSADLSVVDLFRFPTVASLAARLAGQAADLSAPQADRNRGARRRAAIRPRAGRRRAATPGGDA